MFAKGFRFGILVAGLIWNILFQMVCVYVDGSLMLSIVASSIFLYANLSPENLFWNRICRIAEILLISAGVYLATVTGFEGLKVENDIRLLQGLMMGAYSLMFLFGSFLRK